MPIPGQDAVNRFQENEVRFNTFLNTLGTYLTSDGVTQVETLPSLVAEIQAIASAPNIKGNWITATQFIRNDLVKQNSINYLCKNPHISGTFATDLASGNWIIYHAVLDSDLLSNSLNLGTSLVGHISPFTGSIGRNLNTKLSDSLSITDFGAVSGGSATSNSNALNLALAALDLSGGKGASIHFPTGVWTFNQTFTIPSKVELIGNGRDATICIFTHNGTLFLMQSSGNVASSLAGIKGMQIRMPNAGSSATAITILANDTYGSALDNVFDDFAIIADTIVAGQKGIDLQIGGSAIISQCHFSRFLISNVSQPINNQGTEGNFFTDFTINNWGATSGLSAINSSGFANFFKGRIAGNSAATGCYAYAESGARNNAELFIDIANTNYALYITGQSNQVTLGRPENISPIGTFSNSTTLNDNDYGISGRRYQNKGTLPTSAAFTLTNWGTGASIGSIKGSDGKLKFIITCGTSPAANPVVKYTFVDGPWLAAPVVQCTPEGGNSASSIMPLGSSTSTITDWTFSLLGTPTAGNVYAFVVSSN